MLLADEMVCVATTGDWGGEGAVWHPEEQAVFWVDNRRNLVHRFLPRDASVRTWFFDETVAALALTADPGTLCVVLGSGLMHWTPAADRRQAYGPKFESWPITRLNEAGVDPKGRLWLGSMGNDRRPDGSRREMPTDAGALFCLESHDRLTVKVSGIGVANTIAWSPDGDSFYSADTLIGDIRVYAYDSATGEIDAGRDFFKDFPRGRPDGSAVDSEGSLWNCRYGGSCVVRVSPQGAVQGIFECPSLNVTSCVFGGDDLSTLYVTTAMPETSPPGRFDGGLFALTTGVSGQRPRRVTL